VKALNRTMMTIYTLSPRFYVADCIFFFKHPLGFCNMIVAYTHADRFPCYRR
jgi:hypothetical protein